MKNFPRMVILLVLLMTAGPLHAMAGRPPPVWETNIIDHVDKPDRSISFIAFDNTSDNTNQDYLSEEIPKSIALHLQNTKKIYIKREHLYPARNLGKYKVIKFKTYLDRTIVRTNYSFTPPRIKGTNILTNTLLSGLVSNNTFSEPVTNAEGEIIDPGVASNTNLNLDLQAPGLPAITDDQTGPHHVKSSTNESTNIAYPYTNVYTNSSSLTNVFLSDLRTNDYFIFTRTNYDKNGRRESVDAYFWHSNRIYIDPNHTNFSPSMLSNEYILITNSLYTNTDYLDIPEVYILKETNNFRRKLTIDNKLYSGESFNINDLQQNIKSDFIVYGSYSLKSLNELFLKVFLVNRRLGSIEKIYDKEVLPEVLFEEISMIPKLILAKIQNKKTVKNIKFNSEPDDAYVYVDGSYIGNTPLTLPIYPEGAYTVRFWHPRGELDISRTLNLSNQTNGPRLGTNSDFIYYVDEEQKTGLAGVIFDEKSSGREYRIIFRSITESGDFRISVNNTNLGNFYLNSRLLNPRTNQVNGTLKKGLYFIDITGDGFKKRHIQLLIKEDTLTDISLDMIPIRKRSKAHEFFFDHLRNSRFFGALGLTMGGLTIFMNVRKREAEDRYLRYYSDIKSGTSTALNSPDLVYELYQEKERYLKYYRITGYTSLGFLLMSTVSYMIHIKSRVLTIETDYKHGKDVKFLYKRIKEF